MSPRALLLGLLPKVLLSRLTGLAAGMPLPSFVRAPFYRWFARRYGADLAAIDAELRSFRSLQQFFQRSLRPGARPIAAQPLVWPCDGRIVTVSRVAGGRLEQVKGNTYELADLLGDPTLAAALDGGTQATIYLAPGDYHRVHAPFAARIERVVALPGTLFPVNPPAVRCIARLFARNSRHVFHCRLTDGRAGAVVMVGAFNVGGTSVTARAGTQVACGDELGRFGFGSTAIAIAAAGAPTFAPLPAESRVWMGGAATAGRPAAGQ